MRANESARFCIITCVFILKTVITDIVNRSLNDAFIPKSLKPALIISLLKKTNLDTEDFKNFRPVSNLPFVSKLIEKSVAVHKCAVY